MKALVIASHCWGKGFFFNIPVNMIPVLQVIAIVNDRPYFEVSEIVEWPSVDA